MVIYDDFEDGGVSEWTVHDAGWGAMSTPAIGSFSGGIRVANSTEVYAERVIHGCSGGAQPSTLSFRLREASGSYGSGVRFKTSNGSWLCGFATNNPQWVYSDSGSDSEFYNGDGYDRWLDVTFDFNWTTPETTLTVSDPASGTTRSVTFSLNYSDVEKIAFCNYSNGWHSSGWNGGTSNCYSWIDNLGVTGVETAPSAPSNCTAVMNTDSSINVSWTDNSSGDGEEDNFRVQINRDGNGFQDISSNQNDPTPAANVTSILVTADSDQSYYSQVGIDSTFKFRVRAENTSGNSSWATSNTVYTTPVPPSGVSVNRPDANTLTVTYTVESDWASRVDIEYREDTGSGYGNWGNMETVGGYVKGDTDTRTYSVANGDMVEDARYQIRVASYEYQDANNDGSNELLESEYIHASYGNAGNVFFTDDFESGGTNNWDMVSLSDGNSGVKSGPPSESSGDLNISGAATGTYFIEIQTADYVTKNLGDLSGESDVIVQCWMAAGSMDNGSENVGLEWYDGSAWQDLYKLYHEYNRQGWVRVSAVVPSGWLSTDNRLRLMGYGGTGDYFAVDDVVVSDMLHEYTRPAAPSGLVVDASTEDEITATWTNNNVEWGTQTGYRANYKLTTQSSWTYGYNNRTPATSYTFTGLTDGETYDIQTFSFVQQPRHGTGSQYFNSTHITTQATTVLPAATGLSFTTNIEDQLAVSWTKADDNGSGTWEVYRSTDGSLGTAVATGITAGTTSHVDSGLTDGTTYHYTIRRVTDATADSSQVSATTILPSASGVSLDTSTKDEITVSWTKNDDNGGGSWEIYESTDGTTGTAVATGLTASATSYTSTTLTDGQTYYYTVRRVTDTTADAPQQSGVSFLPAPTVTVDTTVNREITVSWTKNDDNSAGSFEVYQSTDGTTGSAIATGLGTTTTSHTESGLLDGEKYYYVVRRVTDATADSTQQSGVTVLPAPTALSATAVGTTTADVSWTANANNGNQRVECKPSDAGTWSNTSGTLSQTTTAYPVTGLRNGEQYDIRVVAFTDHVESADQ